MTAVEMALAAMEETKPGEVPEETTEEIPVEETETTEEN